MAQLRRAKDKHLYILVGPSKGTWQIYDEGVEWLCANLYRIPNQGESTPIDGGTYRYLNDKGYLFIKGLNDRRNSPESIEDSIESIAAGLSLFLQLSEHHRSLWTLKIELSELLDDTKTWAELQRHQNCSITMNAAQFSFSQRHLLNNITCLLEVRPETKAYVVQREDTSRIKHRVLEAPETPGLFDNYKGNIFVESKKNGQQATLWRRCLPGRTLSFTGTILWLASTRHQPEWPGDARLVGLPDSGWHLWRLDISDTSSITWDEIKKWFSYRSIDIVHQQQQVRLITPPEFITDDEWYTCKVGVPLVFQCTPPNRLIGGIVQQSRLSAITFNSNASQLDRSSEVTSAPVLSDKASFFNLVPSQPGQYRIRLNGDVTSDPLFIRINAATTSLPPWLHGFRCTATSSQTRQTFHSFQSILPANHPEGKNQLDQFAQDELPALIWTSEPEGLPVRVTWALEQGMRHNDNSYLIHSGAELTTYWQEYIWKDISNSAEAHITLDAGSFGLIELLLVPMPPQIADKAWWTNEQLCKQLIWLSRVIIDGHDGMQTSTVTSLQHIVRLYCEQVQHIPTLYRALKRIAAANGISTWVLIRLQNILEEIEQ